MIFKFISVYKIIKQKFANKLNELIIAENIYKKNHNDKTGVNFYQNIFLAG